MKFDDLDVFQQQQYRWMEEELDKCEADMEVGLRARAQDHLTECRTMRDKLPKEFEVEGIDDRIADAYHLLYYGIKRQKPAVDS